MSGSSSHHPPRMKVMVGIDEAGYGPTLGPLCLGLSAFRMPAEETRSLPRLLQPVVGRVGTDAARRLLVDDSKRVHARADGLAQLERTALSFARPEQASVASLEALCDASCAPDVAAWPAWYRPTGRFPLVHDGPAIAAERARLQRRLSAVEVSLVAGRPFVVFEPAFNDEVGHRGNKASALLSFVGPLIRDVPERFPDDDVILRVDRLGGRRFYEPFLATLFPFSPMRIAEEGPRVSRYLVRDGARTIDVSFETKADGRHLPVALASLFAKYAREAFVQRLNAHFTGRLASLRPTAGYPQDAARFLDDIAPVLTDAERRTLVRVR